MKNTKYYYTCYADNYTHGRAEFIMYTKLDTLSNIKKFMSFSKFLS